MIRLIAAAAAIALLASPAGAFGKRSEADLELYRRAQKECQSWKYMPDGASFHINYSQGWFRCENRHDRKRQKGSHSK
jgi:hypothetical protein